MNYKILFFCVVLLRISVNFCGCQNEGRDRSLSGIENNVDYIGVRIHSGSTLLKKHQERQIFLRNLAVLDVARDNSNQLPRVLNITKVKLTRPLVVPANGMQKQVFNLAIPGLAGDNSDVAPTVELPETLGADTRKKNDDFDRQFRSLERTLVLRDDKSDNDDKGKETKVGNDDKKARVVVNIVEDIFGPIHDHEEPQGGCFGFMFCCLCRK